MNLLLFKLGLAFFIVSWFTLFIETRQTPNQTATATWSNLRQFRQAARKGRKLILDYADRICRLKTIPSVQRKPITWWQLQGQGRL